MRSVLVGTAGHVDHGKTALIRALTGIDCDRLAEEKRRGITLDLGFAHLPAAAADAVEISFIDDPGHERFLHNALAGLGGVQLLMLVVAADEGVQPQTREHLEIAELLELPGLVVALNKIDSVDADTVELAELELEELLAATRFAGAPILRVSALGGEGVAELRAALERAATALAPPDRAAGPARLLGDGTGRPPADAPRIRLRQDLPLRGLRGEAHLRARHAGAALRVLRHGQRDRGE